MSFEQKIAQGIEYQQHFDPELNLDDEATHLLENLFVQTSKKQFRRRFLVFGKASVHKLQTMLQTILLSLSRTSAWLIATGFCKRALSKYFLTIAIRRSRQAMSLLMVKGFSIRLKTQSKSVSHRELARLTNPDFMSG